MTSVYLTDFDLDGDVCECGAPVKGHPPIAKPSSVTEGRGARSEVDNVFRRYPVFVGPRGEGIQITRPAKPRQAGGRKSTLSDGAVVAMIEAHPQATHKELASYLGLSDAAIYQRMHRMAEDGPLHPVVARWRAERAAKSARSRHTAAGSRW